MLQVSDAYKELVKSNIRPKCEPTIKVSGIDNTGKEIELVWSAKNIKDLKYKRGIDPVGRELPYMELTWTEIYTGKLNAENYPEKYNNIAKYMKVELSFVQDLTFHNTWKSIFKRGEKWSDLFSKFKTWKNVKNKPTQEIIEMPSMFLSARPTISGQTITWTARDLLSFINEVETYSFGQWESEIPLKNAISFFVLNSRGGFLNSRELFDAYTDTVTNLLNTDDVSEKIDKRIICDGNSNEIIKNIASIYNYYFDFKESIAILKKFNPSYVAYKYESKILYDYPKIENATNISSYSFKNRVAESDVSNAYFLTPLQIHQLENTKVGEYFFNGYGDGYISKEDFENGGQSRNIGSINRAYMPVASDDDDMFVVPINYNAYDNAISIDDVGEPLHEDNPINPYDLQSQVAIARKDFLKEYFSANLSVLSFESLANLSVETDDVIEVDTNLYNDDGNKIAKRVLVVYTEITYQGSLKQKIKAHEVNI